MGKGLIKAIKIMELIIFIILAVFALGGVYYFWKNQQTLLMITTGVIFIIIAIGIYPAFIPHKKRWKRNLKKE